MRGCLVALLPSGKSEKYISAGCTCAQGPMIAYKHLLHLRMVFHAIQYFPYQEA